MRRSSWPLLSSCSWRSLSRTCKSGNGSGCKRCRIGRKVHRELRRQKGVTLQLLWQEYRESHPEGYGYSRYCELYRAWAKTLDVTMRFEHKAGEKVFVDYAGPKMAVINPQTGEARDVHIFVAAQGASNYTFAEGTWTEGLQDWIGSHVRMIEFFGGC